MVLHEKGKEKGGMEKEKNKIKKKNEPTSDFAAFFFLLHLQKVAQNGS